MESIDVVANVQHCNIVVSKFEHLSHDYFHFLTSTLGKGMNPLVLQAMGWIV